MRKDWWRAYLRVALECDSPILEAFDVDREKVAGQIKKNLSWLILRGVRSRDDLALLFFMHKCSNYQQEAFLPPLESQ